MPTLKEKITGKRNTQYLQDGMLALPKSKAGSSVTIRQAPGMTIQIPKATTHTGKDAVAHIQRMQKLDSAVKSLIAKKDK